MLLKRLTLHGFKTFATRTVFEFDPGITAVIGPNGSGKSNLADAVRWVLGETSQSLLRSKKTEDVIFVGSHGRSAMGLAEVSLTIDNATGLLATDFAEVTITRRAYRDGENHFLINGSRARLKDIVHLTAPLGGAYTVVGQGLVDAALSLRPEERRGLFDHAAGITGHQIKRGDAERRLQAARANCQRLTDILAELTPRLRQLERQARQAREAAVVEARLTTALRQWYSTQWRQQAAAVVAATATLEDHTTRLAAARRAVSDCELARTAWRGQYDQQRRALSELNQQRAHDERELADLQRQAAVVAERATSLQRQLAGETADTTRLTERRHQLGQELDKVTTALAALTDEQSHAAAALSEAKERARATHAASQEHQSTTATLRQRLLDDTARLSQLTITLGGLRERQASLEREATALKGATLRQHDEQTRLTTRLAEATRQCEAMSSRIAAGAREQAALTDALATAESGLAKSQTALAAGDHDLTACRARLEALTRLRESGAGLQAGPRAVLAAARTGSLPGILGPVASLISAPVDLETALEAALGGHLHDIVVERWRDAEVAIAYLKRSGSGRATFQPLDTLRPPRALASLSGAGIVGPAADLLEYESRYQPLVKALLSRVLVVEDLPTSQRLVTQANGWTLVTLGGEVTRPGGAVTGGTAVREAGLLTRERELRELPRQCQRLEAQQRQQVERVAADQAERARLADAVTLLTTEQTARLRQADQIGHTRDRLVAELTALEVALAAASRNEQTLADRHQQLTAALHQCQTDEAARRASQHTTQAELDQLHQAQLNLGRSHAEALQAVGESQTRLARLEERRHSLQSRRRALTQELAGLTADEQRRDQEQVALRGCLAEATAEQARHEQAQARLTAALTRLTGQSAPMEAALAAAQPHGDQLEADLTRASAALAAAEAALGRAAVVLEASRGHQAALATRLEADLPGVEPASLEAAPTAPEAALAAPEAKAGQAKPDQSEAQLEAQIASLRERRRRLGLADTAVIDEYAAAAERHTFLTRELADVEAAIKTLQAAINDLDSLMRHRFDSTFEAVNAAFEETFRRLFNGGLARLCLTDASDQPGIDIIAQLPGKRPQSLALLSGGERALTAAALLFAILQVNPSPFCLLDEVDAALDESNVTRFRELLADLAQRTQFVVITHNRGTIEGADTLYGISMSQDGLSQVISLRLTPEPPETGPAA